MYSYQVSLFSEDVEYALMASKNLSSYHAMFTMLDLSFLRERKHDLGKKCYSQHAMLRAFIVKTREHIESVPRLIDFLDINPVLTKMCGFTPGKLPDASQFYRFLSQTGHHLIETIFIHLNKRLIEQDVISLDTFIMDSKPVLAATKDNNNKNPDRNLTDKNKKPKRNPNATLGYYAKAPDQTPTFFWGYRSHVIVSKEGIVLVEVTLPNSATDAEVALMLIRKLKRIYKFKNGVIFLGDASYDVHKIYDFIIDKMKCRAFIPINKRNANEPLPMGVNGRPLCDAKLEMSSDGQ